MSDSINYPEILDLIMQENCTLFLGSGFSLDATNILNQKLKTANELKNFLIETIGGTDFDTDLTTASQEYIDKEGEHSLIKLLKNEFTIKSTSVQQDQILSLPWKRIYTTNYDDVVEVASKKSSNYYECISLDQDPTDIKDKTHKCICLNGNIRRLTPQTLYGQFKLTSVSYLTTDFENSNWLSLFRDDLETSDMIIFIGFSMKSDLDIKKIIHGANASKKVVFVIWEGEGKRQINELTFFGDVYPVGVKTFADRLAREHLTYIPSIPKELKLQSFHKTTLALNAPTITDKSVMNLLVDGNYREDLIQYSISNPDTYNYYIYRAKIDDCVNQILKREKHILIHSDLGNGKTLFIEGLALRLKSEGYNVFIFKRYYELIEKEIEDICLTAKPVIIIENYSAHFDILQAIKQVYGNSEVVIIVTERTLMNETVYYDLENQVFGKKYSTYDINRLSVREKNDLAKLIDNYGLWGEFANGDLIFKSNLISGDCRNNIRLVLLKILHSTNIKNKFSDIIRNLKTDKDHLNAVLLLFISNILNLNLKPNDLIYLLDTRIMNNPAFVNNHQIKEIIDFGENEIALRSSILSESLMDEFKESKVIIDLLVSITRKLDKGITSKKYSQQKFILGRIISHTRLQTLFSKTSDNIDELITLYFEKIKHLTYCKDNPNFWLQYAITRLALKDFKSAKTYFDNTYSLIKSKHNYDLTAVNNHFARYLIENELMVNNLETAMKNFIVAHNILNDNNNNSFKYYPYRVALNYKFFYKKFFNRINSQDQQLFINCCYDILERIATYKNEVGNKYKMHEDIARCEQDLNSIVKKESSASRPPRSS